ncbi:hypothetical protein ACHAQA_005220 [Verticillium albo-atrum]
MGRTRSSGAAAKAASSQAPTQDATPLDGCVIVLGGSFPGHTQAELSANIRSLGATVAASVTKKTTHVIVTQANYKTNAKVGQALALDNCLVVSLDWVDESKRLNQKAPEDQFALKDDNSDDEDDDAAAVTTKTKQSPAPVTSNGTANGSQNGATSTRKRPIVAIKNESDDEDKQKVPAKKQKAAASKAKTVDKKPDVVDQVAKSKDLVVPLDEGVSDVYKVFIDPSGMIYDASLNQSNSSNNNNKFYRVQLLQQGSSFKTWTRWGRVGEFGQSALLGSGGFDEALRHFEKKFKDKSGLRWADRAENPKPGKYAFVERSYAPDSDDEDGDDARDAGDANQTASQGGDDEEVLEAKSTLEPSVQDLMALIFNKAHFAATMTELNYDANKLPLGKLSKTTITRGFQFLKDMAELMVDNTLASSKWDMTVDAATEYLSNTFYSIIPHDFGRNRPPVIATTAQLKREIDLLESLSDMKAAADIMKMDRKKTDGANVHPLDKQFQALGLDEMTTLAPKSTEFKELSNYLTETRGDTHYIKYKKVEQIFRIERKGELERFNKLDVSKVGSDKRLLWHGSRTTNFGGILSQGLRIAPPEAPSTGYMFGKGIYLADMSSKSANYCCHHQSDNTALLLLCEAELGDPMQKLTNSSYNAGTSAKQQGLLSTWGQGSTGPSKWKDAGDVHASLKGIKMPDLSEAPGATNVANANLLYNEFITYDVSQVRLRYLLRVKIG